MVEGEDKTLVEEQARHLAEIVGQVVGTRVETA